MVIKPHYEFSVGELTPRRQTLSWFTQSGRVTLPITNNSDCEILFRLEGANETGNCSFEFQVPGEAVSLARQVELRVQPGETVFVPVRITPLSRPLVSLRKQTHFCTITATMLHSGAPIGSAIRRRAVLAQLQSAPFIGPGLTALIAVCLVVLIGLVLQAWGLRRKVTNFSTDVEAVRGDETNRGGHYSDIASGTDRGEMTYEEMFKEIAQQYDLDWRLLAQQSHRESRLDPLAVGDANELGLMQILPSTWNEWAPKVGVTDPYDPYSNALVAAAYLVYLKEYCGNMGYPGDHWMLAAYNWGPHNLRQLFENGGGWAQVPAETRQYVLDIVQVCPRSDLMLGQHISASGSYTETETQAAGPMVCRIERGSCAYRHLIGNLDPTIVFKREEEIPYGEEDILLHPAMLLPLTRLNELVAAEWGGAIQLRVTDAYDSLLEHDLAQPDESRKYSLHFEGRSVDLTTWPTEPALYGRLCALAHCAGFDWVHHEGDHCHASIRAESLCSRCSD